MGGFPTLVDCQGSFVETAACVPSIPDSDQRLKLLQGMLGDSHGCVRLDLDFGAAPNLIREPDGQLIVGDQQTSGVYHAVGLGTRQPRVFSRDGQQARQRWH